MSEAEPKLSAVEGIKSESNFLRGRIAEELVDGNPNLGKDTIQLIKFHGSYEQDDRDRRKEAKANKAPGGKYYSYMIRIAMPGGVIDSPHATGQPHPLRRVHRYCRIEDDRLGNDCRVHVALLQLQSRIGDTRTCIEFAC